MKRWSETRERCVGCKTRLAADLSEHRLCSKCDAVPRDGDRVYCLREDGSISDEGTFDGYHVGDPAMSEVIVALTLKKEHPTDRIIPRRIYEEGMKRNPGVTKEWIKRVRIF